MNRRKSIRQKCLDCSGYEHKEVTDCTITDCPLYPFRGGTGKQNPKERNRAIKDYCLCCMNDQSSEIALCVSPFCSLFPFRGYNRATNASIAEKTAYRGLGRDDLPKVISEPHPGDKPHIKAAIRRVEINYNQTT